MTRGFWEHLDQCLDLLRYLGGHGHRAFNWSCTASSESCRRYLTSLDLRQSYVDSRKTVQFSSVNSMMNIRTLTLSPLFAEFKGEKMPKRMKNPCTNKITRFAQTRKVSDAIRQTLWSSTSLRAPIIGLKGSKEAFSQAIYRMEASKWTTNSFKDCPYIYYIYYPSHSNLIISNPPYIV